jgi:hypothetical protein
MGTHNKLVIFPIKFLCINVADMSLITKIDQLDRNIESPLFPLMLELRHAHTECI